MQFGSCRSHATLLASAESRRASQASEKISSIEAASSAASPGEQSSPVERCDSNDVMPPVNDATHGAPTIIASERKFGPFSM
jgi:hypothetical protein